MKVLLMTFNSSYIHPNLALRWLYVSRDKSHETFIREYTIKDNLDKVIKEIDDLDVDVIGMSVYIWNAEITREFIRKINSDNRYRIILGGPEVTYECDEWLDENIEGIIKGEGEISFWDAVNHKSNIDGFYSKEYKSEVAYARVDIDYLESLESPYYLSFDDNNRHNRYMYLETSRGCPYRCSYCLSSLDNHVRNFSLEYVYRQLDMLKTHPVKQVKFLDRTFNSHPKRALDIARYINKLDVDVSFQFEVALEFFSKDLLDFFVNAKKDRFRFEVGVQTFNQKTLQAINRVQDEKRLSDNISLFARNGLIMHTDLIAGLPYEGYDSFKESFYKLFRLHSDEIQMGILKLLKGTVMKREALQNGTIANNYPPYEVISTRWLSKGEMDRIKGVAKVLDKTYNNSRMRYTFDTLYEMGFDIFEIMADYQKRLSTINKIQISDYFVELDKIMDDEYQTDIKGILLNDYYRLFNERPKPIFKRPDETIRKELYKKLIEQGYDEHMLNQYSLLDYGYENGLIYQLIIYSPLHKLARIEKYSLDLDRIG